ncbi:MAG: 2-C-methyl-D-erythritol 2,4-cyclodiphosphate synthase [Candidatus Rifleibacteriota bacterium]
MDIRVGLGHDIHAIVEGRELWLGGEKIPFEKGLLGHSDADVLLHAIMDALLGALALGDIGRLFPDSDPAFKGISSVKLANVVMDKVTNAGYRVANIDCIIHCEKPKISPHRYRIVNKIAEILKIPPDRVSVKSGTNEGFDAVGQEKAISCQAIVLLVKDESFL